MLSAASCFLLSIDATARPDNTAATEPVTAVDRNTPASEPSLDWRAILDQNHAAQNTGQTGSESASKSSVPGLIESASAGNDKGDAVTLDKTRGGTGSGAGDAARDDTVTAPGMTDLTTRTVNIMRPRAEEPTTSSRSPGEALVPFDGAAATEEAHTNTAARVAQIPFSGYLSPAGRQLQSHYLKERSLRD